MSSLYKIKVSNLNIIKDRPIYGQLYRKVFKPLAFGEIYSLNLSFIRVKYEGDMYSIKVDKPHTDELVIPGKTKVEAYEIRIKELMEHLRDMDVLYLNTGATIYEGLTGCDNIHKALLINNTFSKGGATVTARKIASGDEGTTMQYLVNVDIQHSSKAPPLSHSFRTTDADELLVFLGSLSRIFTVARHRELSSQ